MISFLYPLFLGLIPVALFEVYLAFRRRASYGFTQLEIQRNLRTISLVNHLPPVFLGGFLICLCLAIARPVISESHAKQSIQTRDFCIAVDISSSMELQIADNPDAALNQAKTSRIALAREAIDKFIPTRKGDRICYIEFDDEAYFGWPLTTDLDLIAMRNSHLVSNPDGGTNFDGPDESGLSKTGPIQAAIDHFKEQGAAKTKVLIMVTDGEASIGPERRRQLSTLLKDGNIRVYVLGIAQGWVNNSKSVQDLQQLAIDSGGKVLPVGDEAAMAAGFDEINKLEKTQIFVEQRTTYRDIYQYFTIAALIFALGLGALSALIRDHF